MQNKLQATFNNIIVKQLEIHQSSNIIVPHSDDNTIYGEIISVGPGFTSMSGSFIKTQSKIGDKVILPKLGFSRFEFQGEEYLLGKEQEILAIIEEN